MAVLGVPNIRVLKPVHVHVELTVGIHVHVGNEEMYDEPSAPLSLKYFWELYRIWDVKSSSPSHQLAVFLFSKNASTLLQDVSGKTLETVSQQPPLEAVAARYFRIASLVYKKIPWIPKIKESKGLKRKGQRAKLKPVAEPPPDGGTRRAKHTRPQTGPRPRGAHRRKTRARRQRRNGHATQIKKMSRSHQSLTSCDAFSQISLFDA